MPSNSQRDLICSWRHCSKTFHRKSDLDRHYRIHTNDRPWRCEEKDCTKRFIQRSALTVHLRTHTGERPHRCGHDGCQKAFSDSSSLSRHHRVHTGDRPFVCHEPTCKRSFCRKRSLIQHQSRCHKVNHQACPESLLPESSSRKAQQQLVQGSLSLNQQWRDHYWEHPHFKRVAYPGCEIDLFPEAHPMAISNDLSFPSTTIQSVPHTPCFVRRDTQNFPLEQQNNTALTLQVPLLDPYASWSSIDEYHPPDSQYMYHHLFHQDTQRNIRMHQPLPERNHISPDFSAVCDKNQIYSSIPQTSFPQAFQDMNPWKY